MPCRSHRSGGPGFVHEVRRLSSEKSAQNQWLMKSVLKPRSRELRRQRGQEREFRVSAGGSQCGGLFARPAAIGDLGGVPSQRRTFAAGELAEREELGSNILHLFGDRRRTDPPVSPARSSIRRGCHIEISTARPARCCSRSKFPP